MTRLLVHVEGETEEAFVREVLRPHLISAGYLQVDARIVGNSRQRDRRGGIQGWPTVRRGIVNHLRQDGGVLVTTMVDYYALPSAGPNAWPGRAVPATLSMTDKAETVHQAVSADIDAEMGWAPNRSRFKPFVVMYEFEGLLFSDVDRFAAGIGRPELAPRFLEIRNQFESPEHINDSPQTAPSKRILSIHPEYEKPLLGCLAALEIGLDGVRNSCAMFDRWLAALEEWPDSLDS